MLERSLTHSQNSIQIEIMLSFKQDQYLCKAYTKYAYYHQVFYYLSSNTKMTRIPANMSI